ncbi:hypothetical protein ACFQEX_25160 [Roseibium salinum]|uniref:hypothetical protein n=1 Tax=Roseibium salinum TaxID=1604349 RepID=UPI00361BF5BB
MHLTTPEREFEALTAIQSARYVDGRDNGDAAVIGSVLTGLGLGDAAKRFAAPDAELLKFNKSRIETAQAEMRRFGASGVPTLVAGEGAGARVVGSNALYGKPDALIAALRAA